MLVCAKFQNKLYFLKKNLHSLQVVVLYSAWIYAYVMMKQYPTESKIWCALSFSFFLSYYPAHNYSLIQGLIIIQGLLRRFWICIIQVYSKCRQYIRDVDNPDLHLNKPCFCPYFTFIIGKTCQITNSRTIIKFGERYFDGGMECHCPSHGSLEAECIYV